MNRLYLSQTSEKEIQRQAELLELLINNTRDLYDKKIAIYKNLWKFYRAGKFNVARATQAFSYLTDDVARKYNNQASGGEIKISVMARRLQDTIFISDFLGAAIKKDYDFMR